jgi:beta-lactamase class A
VVKRVLSRRQAAFGIVASAVGYGLGVAGRQAQAARAPFEGLEADLAKLETEGGGRLGVAVLDTGSRTLTGYRADERFPMCSTFNLLAAAAVLKRVEQGKEKLDRRVTFTAGEIVVNSAITKDRVGGDGMTVAELCQAAMTWSDNTAGNLLLASLGGTQALTDYARSLGDTITRLDRIEPDLNEALPGDLRDTTTPTAMSKNIESLVLGNALSEDSKEQLTTWLVGNKTGNARLRAGLPADWRVGDKTGSGDHGTTNDVGAAWPPQAAPVFVAIYLTGTAASSDERNRTIASVGHAIAARLRS